MSKTRITSKSYYEVKRDGKTVDKKMLDATYDGKRAVIDQFENNRAYRYELSPQDIQDMIKKMSHGNSNSLVEPSVVSSRSSRGRGRGRGRGSKKHGRSKRQTRGKKK